MGLLKRLLSGNKSATPVEPKTAVSAAPHRTMVTVVTLAPTGSESVVAQLPSPARDPVVPKPIAVELTITPPNKGSQELLDRIRTRNERHNDLDALIAIEKTLPSEKQNQRMAELQKAVVDAIETCANQGEYRKAYYLYQSALHATQRGL
jgi:hypothetical protein